MRKRILLIVLVLTMVPVCASGKKALVRIERTFAFENPTSIVLLSPEERAKRNTEFEDRPNELRYDESEGVYIYTYWLESGEKMEARYEPSNKINVIVSCCVFPEHEKGLYFYNYILNNLPTSKQSLRYAIIDVDPDCVARAEVTPGWLYFSPFTRSVRKTRWAFFASQLSDIPIGSALRISFRSDQGPVLVDCYLSGRAKVFPSPVGSGDGFCGVPPNREGVRGKTLGPGRVDTRKDIADHVRDDLAAALEWGWLDADAHQSLAEKYLRGKPIDRARLKKLVQETRALGRAKRAEPELTALLEYLGWSYFHERY